MPKKKIEISKRNNSAFFKYSNQEVFERREKEFFKNKKEKNYTLHIYPFTSRNRYRNIKQKFIKEKNIIQYLKTLQSLNSEIQNISNKDYFQTISYNTKIDNLKKRIKTCKNKKNTYYNNNIFNLTETGNIKKKSLLYNNNNSAKYYHTIASNKINNINYIKNKNIRTKNDYNYQDINQLLLTKKQKKLNDLKTNESQEKIDKIKDLKILQFNPVKEGFRDYIEKIRKYDLIQYSTKVKNERAIQLKEIYNNKIEFYKDTYNTLFKSKKLFERKFLIKISEYLKFLSIKIQKEIHENTKLINQIRKNKWEIEMINTKMKKLESEKANIIRWLYLQIQVKEKKLYLPDYYKHIIESNNRKKIHLLSKTKNNNIKKEKEKKIFKNNINLKSSLFNNELNNEKINSDNNIIDLNGNRIDNEEYLRIRKYKNELIYKTPEQFNEALLNLENNNLKLINYKDNLKENIFFLKKEFNKTLKEKENLENYFNSKITNNESELKEIKSTMNINSKYNIYLETKKKNKMSILYSKVFFIYTNCKSIDNDTEDINENILKITPEEKIINLLRYIEIKVDRIINKINSYIKKERNISIKDFLLKIKLLIDKAHKNEKAQIQKLNQKEKYKKLCEKIEARNNKIYIIPKKKLDISKIKSKKNKIVEKKIEKKEEKNLQDFLQE